MRSILCATDYSSNSIAALKLADTLAKSLKCPLYVLHVFDMSATFISTVSTAYQRMEEAAFKDHRQRLRDFCVEQLGPRPEGEDFNIEIEEHSLAHFAISEKAEELEADLVLVGMKGSSVLKDLVIGSTANALIEKSPCPVLAVPENAALKEIKTVLYATAFEEADILAINKTVALFGPLGAEIHLLHVSTKKEYAGEDQMEWFKEMLRQKVFYKKIHFELRHAEEIFTSLMDYVQEIQPQVLVMLEREGHSLISSIWHRDLVKRAKTENRLPLLCYHKANLKSYR